MDPMDQRCPKRDSPHFWWKRGGFWLGRVFLGGRGVLELVWSNFLRYLDDQVGKATKFLRMLRKDNPPGGCFPRFPFPFFLFSNPCFTSPGFFAVPVFVFFSSGFFHQKKADLHLRQSPQRKTSTRRMGSQDLVQWLGSPVYFSHEWPCKEAEQPDP